MFELMQSILFIFIEIVCCKIFYETFGEVRYKGWINTIQFILEWSIGKLVGYRVHVDGSGRTDAGVHARGQVASVKLSKLYDTKELKESLNR